MHRIRIAGLLLLVAGLASCPMPKDTRAAKGSPGSKDPNSARSDGATPSSGSDAGPAPTQGSPGPKDPGDAASSGSGKSPP